MSPFVVPTGRLPLLREPAFWVFASVLLVPGVLVAAVLLLALGPDQSAAILAAAGSTLLLCGLISGFGMIAFVRHRHLRALFPHAAVWSAVSAPATISALRAAYPDAWLGRRLPLTGFAVVYSDAGVGFYSGTTRPRRFFGIAAGDFYSLEAGTITAGTREGVSLVVRALSSEGPVAIPVAVTADRTGLRRLTSDPFETQGVLLVGVRKEDYRGLLVIVSRRILAGETSPAWMERLDPENEHDTGWVVVGHDEEELAQVAANYTPEFWSTVSDAHPVIRPARGWPVGTMFTIAEEEGTGRPALYHHDLKRFIRPSPEDSDSQQT